MAIRVLLADNHQVIRAGMRFILEQTRQYQVVAEASDGLDAVRLAGETSPDLVILDIQMPRLNGIDVARHIRNKLPGAIIVAFSVHAEKSFALNMLHAGASGYILKDADCNELLSALSIVMNGQLYVSPQLNAEFIRDYLLRCKRKQSSAFSILTSREREVLQLLSEGLSSKEIAGQLTLKVKTVDNTRQHIMDKLQLRSIAALTKYAIREGLTRI